MDFPGEGEIALRLVLAVVLGGLIGLERELTGHPAGLRTHIAVALGAALFGVASAYGFEEFNASRTETNYQVDPTRVASNIVVGIGFLGGGAILKQGATVRGLTTAGSLWVTAAIGLGCALGSYSATLVTAGLMLLTLVLLRGPARWLKQRRRSRETVIVRLHPGAHSSAAVQALAEIEGVTLRSFTVRQDENHWVINADVVGETGGDDLEAKLAPLAELDDVADLQVP